ncbi:hypothetical protein B0H14DRAFT_2586032 [Mycena olivaceomarginata]|nr:hypothetical protein B0H14DRAFT_2586032 [Mycena olivaceomarginata]
MTDSHRLTMTPLFRQNSWLSLPMHEGTWHGLSSDVLGPVHTVFVNALKLLDVQAYPNDGTDHDRIDFRIILSLPVTFPQLASSTQGRLAKPGSVLQLLKKLARWNEHLTGFSTQLKDDLPEVTATSSPETQIPLVESLDAVLNFSKIKGKTLAAKALKNLQGMAAGLIWILEGHLVLQLLTIMAGLPFVHLITSNNATMGMRCFYLPETILIQFSVVTDATELKLLDDIGTVEQLLRPLSYALNISYTTVFIDVDLQAIHVDVIVQQNIRNIVSSFTDGLSALPYVQECMKALVRAICARNVSAASAIESHFNSLIHDLPPTSEADLEIFKRIVARYAEEKNQLLAPTTPIADPLPIQPLRPANQFKSPPEIIWLESMPEHVGPIARAFSVNPEAVHTVQSWLSAPTPSSVIAPSQIDPVGTVLRSAEPTSESVENTMWLTFQSCHLRKWRHLKPILHRLLLYPRQHYFAYIKTFRGGRSQHLYPAIARNRSDSKQSSIFSLMPTPFLEPAADVSNQLSREITPTTENDPGSIVSLTPKPSVEATANVSTQLSPEIALTKKNPASGVSLPTGLSLELATNNSEQNAPAMDIDQQHPIPPPTSDSLQSRRSSRHQPSKLDSKVKAAPAGGDLKRKVYRPGRNVRKKLKINSKNVENPPNSEPNSAESGDEEDLDDEIGRLEGLDFWLNDLRDEKPLMRSTTAQVITGLLPDGQTEQSFDYIGHSSTVTQRMPIGKAMKYSCALAHIWGTGRDLFINGVRPSPVVKDICHDMALNHRLDAPIEVQVQGLCEAAGDDKEAEVDHTRSIRTTTLATMLENDGQTGGFVLNALDLAAGAKFWIRCRRKDGQYELTDTRAFDDWDPESASPNTDEYEVTVLPAGSGVYLQQPGRHHAVIGAGSTVTVGGYFFCAASMRVSMSITFHMVMLQHVLTNAAQVSMWQFFIRICMFWLVVTKDCPTQHDALAAYLPDLSTDNARGWMDIIYLSCMILLFPALDHRNYDGTGTPDSEICQADSVGNKYMEWRAWMAASMPSTSISNVMAVTAFRQFPGRTCGHVWRGFAEVGLGASAGFSRQSCAQLRQASCEAASRHLAPPLSRCAEAPQRISPKGPPMYLLCQLWPKQDSGQPSRWPYPQRYT